MEQATAHTASASREVLARAEYFLHDLRRNPKGIEWQAKLSAAIALLRSVGHILEKRDARASSFLKVAIAHWWINLNAEKANKRPGIFWGFIDEDRHLIMKEGELRAGYSVTVYPTGLRTTALVAGQVHNMTLPDEHTHALYTYHMNGGLFDGRDPHDLVEDAIEWWRCQLSLIEKAAEEAHAIDIRNIHRCQQWERK